MLPGIPQAYGLNRSARSASLWVKEKENFMSFEI
jgi:hypothetical protein